MLNDHLISRIYSLIHNWCKKCAQALTLAILFPGGGGGGHSGFQVTGMSEGFWGGVEILRFGDFLSRKIFIFGKYFFG